MSTLHATGGSYLAAHIAWDLTAVTALLLAAAGAVALLRPPLSAVWGRIRQGFTVVRHGARTLRR